MTVSWSTYLLVYLSLQSHHKDWLTYYGGTDTPGELFIIFLSQTTTLIVNFATWISVTLTIQLFWIYFFFLILVFVLQ